MDTRTPDQLSYEQYLSTLSRAERRRILKAHFDRAEKSARAAKREALHTKRPPIDLADLPYMKEA